MILLITQRQFFAYSLTSNKWNILNVKYDEYAAGYKLSHDQFGYILSKDKRFIILFPTSGIIYIVDLLSMKIHKSKVVCPIEKGVSDFINYHAILGGNIIKDEN